MYEFDHDYMVDAAKGAVHYLRRDRACELDYQPGNGTLYGLILIPAGGLAKAADWMDHFKARSITADRPELADADGGADAWILLAWLGHGCWPVDLRAIWAPPYFAEKFADCTIGDAEALRALLLAIAETSGHRRLQVTS